jgi:two-component system cell cycle sensor histidine kinase/response regulator CckA
VPRMLRLMRRVVGEEINLVWQTSDNLWTMLIDPLQLDQILANLLVNSRDAIDGPGKIVVSARNVTAACEFASVTGIPQDAVALAVTDNGCGMNDAVKARIFEPFFTTKETGKGSGLGLATVYGIVTQNGGTIHVQSAPGKGTTLTLYFPRTVDSQRDSGALPVQEISRRGHETVLFVEDEPMVLSLGESILQRLGYTVIIAKTPKEALRIAESHSHPIQLLVTDLAMPEMNGKVLADELLRVRPELRVLYISGFTADVIARRSALEVGARILQKPFTSNELAAVVREVLETDSPANVPDSSSDFKVGA